jgi:hypothetical protein
MKIQKNISEPFSIVLSYGTIALSGNCPVTTLVGLLQMKISSFLLPLVKD